MINCLGHLGQTPRAIQFEQASASAFILLTPTFAESLVGPDVVHDQGVVLRRRSLTCYWSDRGVL